MLRYSLHNGTVSKTLKLFKSCGDHSGLDPIDLSKGNLMSENIRPSFDKELIAIADYVINTDTYADKFSSLAHDTAYYCLLDTLGCGILALNYPQCSKLIGPVVPGSEVANGARVPGTTLQLDPQQAAFCIGTMNRWLDFNDTWLAAEWGHPSDNLAGILAVADYISRQQQQEEPANFSSSPKQHISSAFKQKNLLMQDVLRSLIQAYEIQGVLALENSFNRVGLDHVLLVKVATVALVTKLLGGDKQAIVNALSQVWLDGHSLRTYRHAPNTGPRKSWAAGDASSRAVRLAMLTILGEPGYPSTLSAPTWGFCDVLFGGEPLKRTQQYQSYVMENILFKLKYPAEFHAQTAVECSVKLYPLLKGRIDAIEKIVIHSQESALRIIDKSGPLYNPADRDHCLQYMVAVPLLFGNLTADHYLDATASNVNIDKLRSKMQVIENKQYSQDYLDPQKRSIANAIQIFFTDGSSTEKVEVEYPVGHRKRREEGIPLLLEKFKKNLCSYFSEEQAEKIEQACLDKERLLALPVREFMDLWKLSI